MTLSGGAINARSTAVATATISRVFGRRRRRRRPTDPFIRRNAAREAALRALDRAAGRLSRPIGSRWPAGRSSVGPSVRLSVGPTVGPSLTRVYASRVAVCLIDTQPVLPSRSHLGTAIGADIYHVPALIFQCCSYYDRSLIMQKILVDRSSNRFSIASQELITSKQDVLR